MVEFKSLMSPPQRAYYERVDQEIARLFCLSNRFLARALIGHARDARVWHPDFLALGAGPGTRNVSTLVWDIIPEISHRLGEGTMLSGERSLRVRGMSNGEFRIYAGQLIMSCANIILDDWKRVRNHQAIDPLEVLTHDVANGNPVAFALDRVAPARSSDQKDPLSCYTREISENRGFQPPFLMWTPEMQDYGHLPAPFAITM